MRKSSLFTLCAAVLGLVLAGCNQDVEPPETASEAPATPAAEPAQPAPAPTGTAGATPDTAAAESALKVASDGAPGPYITNSAGNALYLLEGNTDGTKCTDDCLKAWPPLLVADAAPTAGAGLQAALVGQIGRVDGSSQVTYNGHPLHRYAADTGIGSTAGHGVEDKWGKWYLVTPQGTALQVDSTE